MHPFQLVESQSVEGAIHAVAADPQAVFFAGAPRSSSHEIGRHDSGALVDVNRTLPDAIVESGGTIQSAPTYATAISRNTA